MRKDEMITLLRSAGVGENAVTLAINAWELGVEWEREASTRLCYEHGEESGYNIATLINARGKDGKD